MPEEIELDAREDQERVEELHHQHEEHAHAQGEEKKQAAWTRGISLSTAVLAVIAAVAALQSGSLVNEALAEQIKATQYQTRASDSWAYYQAKSIKQNGAEQTADILAATPTQQANAEKYRKQAEGYGEEKKEQQAEAKELENKRDESNKESEHFFHNHHTFAYCVTLTQIAIALSAIAALTRLKGMWYVSIVVGVIGLGFLLYGFMAK